MADPRPSTEEQLSNFRAACQLAHEFAVSGASASAAGVLGLVLEGREWRGWRVGEHGEHQDYVDATTDPTELMRSAARNADAYRYLRSIVDEAVALLAVQIGTPLANEPEETRNERESLRKLLLQVQTYAPNPPPFDQSALFEAFYNDWQILKTKFRNRHSTYIKLLGVVKDAVSFHWIRKHPDVTVELLRAALKEVGKVPKLRAWDGERAHFWRAVAEITRATVNDNVEEHMHVLREVLELAVGLVPWNPED